MRRFYSTLLMWGTFSGLGFTQVNLSRFEVSGTFEKKGARPLVLDYFDKTMGRYRADTFYTKPDGSFAFTGIAASNYERAVLYQPKTEQGGQRDAITFYLDPVEKITFLIQDSLKSAVVRGSKLNIDFMYYTRHIAQQPESVLTEYIKTHSSSYSTIDALFELIARQNNGTYEIVAPEKIQLLIGGLSDELQNTPAASNIRARVQGALQTQVGKTAPEIIARDTLGQTVKLSDFRGKYVLLDFWASWCRPCRAENPNLVQAYRKHGNKSFTIVSFSNDRDASKWKEAIQRDSLSWNHISTLETVPRVFTETYARMSLPANYLLDPAGVIIAKNIYGEKLAAKLEEILGK